MQLADPLAVEGTRLSSTRRRWHCWWTLGFAAALLAGCGSLGAAAASPTSPPTTATATADASAGAGQIATAQAFGTANAQRLAAMLTPTPATPTPRPAPTSTSAPTTTPVATPLTATPLPSPSAAPATELATWPVGSVGGKYPAKTSYDAASKMFTIALTDPAQFYAFPIYQPGGSAFTGVRIDVDIHRAAGPGDGAYGAVCGVQGTGEKRAGYNVLLYPDTQQFSVSWHPSVGRGQVVVPVTGLSAIKQGEGLNHLQVTCRRDAIVVAVNGITAGTYAAPQETAGEIGLIVVAPPHPAGPTGMAAAFAHLLVTSLS